MVPIVFSREGLANDLPDETLAELRCSLLHEIQFTICSVVLHPGDEVLPALKVYTTLMSSCTWCGPQLVKVLMRRLQLPAISCHGTKKTGSCS